MLRDGVMHPSLATSDIGAAKDWYAAKLGWQPAEEYAGLLIYRVGSSLFSVYETAAARTAKNTVAGYEANDFASEADRLRARGLTFEDFEWPGRSSVGGVFTLDGGLRRAWFVDADRNWWVMGDDEGRRGPRVSTVLAATDLERARRWYADQLGYEPTDASDGELEYELETQAFSIYATPNAGTARNTVAVWRVKDIRAEMAELRARGVVFNDYDLGDAQTVDGLLIDPEGEMVAWFTDSEGNILGIAEDPT